MLNGRRYRAEVSRRTETANNDCLRRKALPSLICSSCPLKGTCEPPGRSGIPAGTSLHTISNQLDMHTKGATKCVSLAFLTVLPTILATGSFTNAAMPSWLPSIAYPSPRNGYWGPVTSTLNWCEEVCHIASL